ncbi:MAG: TonB-dependent receptor plug domain-containing protein [Tannerellaceae bacterium]|nr:TonB-dependent receptor plug domain-containing protein [Tannerellaceae bacterium]
MLTNKKRLGIVVIPFLLLIPYHQLGASAIDRNIYVVESTQQIKDISGNISDGVEPIIGANIQVKGSETGTISDINGDFSLKNIPMGSTLIISYIGYLTQEIIYQGQIPFNIVLREDSKSLEEVVVVGYQSKERKNLTGSVVTVDSKMLEDRPAARGTDLLQGVAPGLILTRGNPGRLGGGDVGIEIQGVSARTGSDVLVVIDGLPQPLGSIDAINSVNPNDIETISVLKDGEAVVYGSRASSGVIVITTKSGKKNRVDVSYTSSFKQPSIYNRKTNVIETMLLMDKAWSMSGAEIMFGYPGVINYIKDNNLTFNDIKNNDYKHIVTGQAPFPDTPVLVFSHHDWMKEMYSTVITHNYDVSFSGSTEKASYYTSVGYIDEGSMLRYGDNSNKTTFARLKLDYRYNKWLTVGTNMSMRYQNLVEPVDIAGLEFTIANRPPWDVPYTPSGNYSVWGGLRNPIGHAEERGHLNQKRYMVNGQFFMEATPINNLKIRAVAQKKL